ncbi:sensor histidine kinase [Geothermobacter hydrogeniphilus]|uniref:histidine kinase n=1 Tax=Geothermobacter hydrogeniphilus TaxID=1969733 RepID=A0A1X0YB18_9BACT|nr:HAMP domain-containing sensor histidine kinase [Geothermobacter hydrogeniphilus]ORJ62184.1 hypothetical protein B5V00_05410 [Geothermobacter hydrogeniphilus]
MRLTLKIAVALLLTVALLFAIYSWQTVKRERVQIKANLSREARQVGIVLRQMTAEIWQTRGERGAMIFLKRNRRLEGGQRVRWVWLEGETSDRFTPLQDPKLEATHQGEIVTLLAETDEGKDYLFTYLPLVTPGGRLGAVEVSESLAEMHGYVRESMRRSAFMLATAVACSLLLITVIGSIWVDRPVKKLAAHAERIADGDFSGPVESDSRDEFGLLAGALEKMRGQLASARTADQARLDALEKLRHTERLATLGRLSAGMAHELGTPLNVIAGRAKLLSRDGLTAEEVQRNARIIGDQAQRMTLIMRQLLDFARRGELRKHPLELSGLATTVINLVHPAAEKQGVELQLDIRQPDVRAAADAGQLQQVLINLSMNGIQAMPEGGVLVLRVDRPREVSPPAEVDHPGPWVSLAVSDQGTGIDEKNLQQLFDPFFTTKEIGQGTGLGLSIAWGIARDHGGWIGVESTLGKGSCFTLYLPEYQEQEA